jgi:hypothetical protein
VENLRYDRGEALRREFSFFRVAKKSLGLNNLRGVRLFALGYIYGGLMVWIRGVIGAMNARGRGRYPRIRAIDFAGARGTPPWKPSGREPQDAVAPLNKGARVLVSS